MIKGRNVVALVPIKEHSERVEGKNFRPFCGKPLYHHILHTLADMDSIDEVVVDTDSRRVIEEAPALSHKITPVERPASLRGDRVSTNLLFEYDMSRVEAGLFLQTHATNPLLKQKSIDRALQMFCDHESDYDSLFSVNRFFSRFYLPNGTPVNHDPDKLIRTQDLEPVYEENSCIYVFTRQSFQKRRHRIGNRPFMLPIPHVEAIDIDDEFSFRLAELLAMYEHTP